MRYDDDDRDDYRPREVRATCGECGCSTQFHAQGCPETPDDGEDERGIDELTPAEQRARLRTLSMADLIEQCLEALADAQLWFRQFEREKHARQLAEARMQQNAELLNALRDKVAA